MKLDKDLKTEFKGVCSDEACLCGKMAAARCEEDEGWAENGASLMRTLNTTRVKPRDKLV